MVSIDYDLILPRKVVEMPPSGIRKFFDLLDGMNDVIALTVGQPDFVTPWHIREAGIESLEKGKTYYTSNAGTLELRQEICKYLERRFNLSYDPVRETIVTVGGSEAIDMAMRTLLSPGDEVIIPTPCFVCYEPLARLCGAVPVTVLDAARQAEVSDPPNCTVVATGSKATSLTSPTTSYLCATGWIVRNADITDGAENSSVKSAFPLTARSYQPSARDIVSPNSGCPWTVTAAPNIGRPSPSRTRPRTTETRSGTIKSPFTPVWIGFGPE